VALDWRLEIDAEPRRQDQIGNTMCTDLLIIAQTMICYTFNDYEPPSETEVRQVKILRILIRDMVFGIQTGIKRSDWLSRPGTTVV
jgi:hypothetical protein